MYSSEKKYWEIAHFYQSVIKFKPVSVADQINENDDSDNNGIELPECQRDKVWSDDLKQEFIKSICMGIATNEFVLNKVKKNKKIKYNILDGQHRIDSIKCFMENEFPIKSDKNFIWYDKINSDKISNKHKVMNDVEKQQFLDSKIPVCLYENLDTKEELNIFTKISLGVQNDQFGSKSTSLEKYLSKFKQYEEFWSKEQLNEIVLNLTYIVWSFKEEVEEKSDEEIDFSEILDIIIKDLRTSHRNIIIQQIMSDEFDQSILELAQEYFDFIYSNQMLLNNTILSNNLHYTQSKKIHWCVQYTMFESFYTDYENTIKICPIYVKAIVQNRSNHSGSIKDNVKKLNKQINELK